MIRSIEEMVGRTASRFGLAISRTATLKNELPVEATNREREIIKSVRPFTMTSSGRIWSLLRAVEYDTFQGMTAPTHHDVASTGGASAAQLLSTTAVADGNNVWCVASLEDVETNISKTSYSPEQLVFIKGDVASTLKERAPNDIALLRLDTDWYESTKAELEVLYPKLVPGGVCILDDYGHWQGARKAVDDYFRQLGARPLLMPIDFSGRIFTKPL